MLWSGSRDVIDFSDENTFAKEGSWAFKVIDSHFQDRSA